MDACVVKYIDVFLKFDSTLDENLRQPGAKSLTKQQIELFIDGVLSYKKEEALKTGEEILNEL
ncbi:MAG: hypothetical protein H6767_07255 [Candidatus Peribacteria bacterium]|nr:MAG: hypothetical protein H6767_07255 [Candidatus Peribacteria bacterium]